MSELPSFPSGLPSRGGGNIGGNNGGNGRNGNTGNIIKFVGVGLVSAALFFKECNCSPTEDNLASKEETKERDERIEEGAKELGQEVLEKITQPKDTTKTTNYPERTPSEQVDKSNTTISPQQTTIYSREETCNLLKGAWGVALVQGKETVNIEKWVFDCIGDDKIEITLGVESLFSREGYRLEGDVYTLQFKNEGTRYVYNIDLKIVNGKLVGNGSIKTTSRNDETIYTLEMRKQK